MRQQRRAGAGLELADPAGIRAEMARNGLTFTQLLPYEDAEFGYVNPLDDHETQIAVRRFFGRLWRACLSAAAHPGEVADAAAAADGPLLPNELREHIHQFIRKAESDVDSDPYVHQAVALLSDIVEIYGGDDAAEQQAKTQGKVTPSSSSIPQHQQQV